MVNGPGAALLGLVGGFIVPYTTSFLLKIGIDDVVSAVSVPGVAGAWGTIGLGLLISNEALGEQSR